MNGKLILPFVFIFCFYACDSNIKVPEDKALEVKFSPLFKLKYSNKDDNRLELSGVHGYVLNDSAYFAFMNHRSGNLHILNFERNESLPQVIELDDSVLQRNDFGNIHNFSVVDDDKLVFIQESRFGVYDLNTHQIEFEQSNIGSDSLPIYFNFLGTYIPMHYNDSLKELYIECVDFREQSEEKAYGYEMKFHYKTNVVTKEFSLLPVMFPESWGNGELGMSAKVSCIYKGDSIIYNFYNEDNLLIYNKSTKEMSNLPARSTYHKDIPPLDTLEMKSTDKMRAHRDINFAYTTIGYDKWKNCYYRIYSKSQPARNEEGFFNTSEEREEGVIVMDDKLNIIGEFTIPEKKAHDFCVSKKGLMYMMPKYANDTLLEGYIKFGVANVQL